MTVKTWRNPAVLSALICLLFLLLAGHGAEAQTSLEPGLYQYQDLATCQLSPQEDGSWRMLFWQGDSLEGPGQGFAFLGRLLPDPGHTRLSGAWQALPGSCCPGRGRGEIQVLGPKKFRFGAFAPSLDQAAWPVLPQAEFTWAAPLPAVKSASFLEGPWRMALWYTDLLPQKAADLSEGKVTLTADGEGASGVWQGKPGNLRLDPAQPGYRLSYQDQAAGFDLSASLSRTAGGLCLEGPFQSTLGRGRLRLVRAGLPAEPGGMARAAGGGDLGGLWVDPRTGNDFIEIEDTGGGFDFTAYGGDKERPRYLSRGRATPAGPQTFAGEAADAKGYCCGNQGRVVFMVLDPEQIELSSVWWPKGQPDPQTKPGQPYVLQKMKAAPKAASAQLEREQGAWPVIQAARPGLLAPEGGAVRVRFIWRPTEGDRIYTLFSQGGYGQDIDLFIDPQGRLAAKIAVSLAGGDKIVEAVGQAKVSPDEPHDAWLVYNAGDKLGLYLDDEPVALAQLPGAWVGSASPYIIGGSRWPGRGFAGAITQLDLWSAPQDPRSPNPPAYNITLAETAQSEKASLAHAETLPLLRLWHPRRLVHAYAAGFDQASVLGGQGFVLEGPIGRILAKEAPGAKGLWAFRHREGGYTILALEQAAPEGCDSLGLLGYVWPQAAPDTTALNQLSAIFVEPLRGGKSQDMLYTSRQETIPAAQEAGYGKASLVGYLRPAKEPDYQPPVLYTWQGAWEGEGWGHFYVSRQGDNLAMYWYYGGQKNQYYLGRYRLRPDGRKAEGVAYGPVGGKPSFYRHQITFDAEAASGPKAELSSWRVAAPLDDGRMVRFKEPPPDRTTLEKSGQNLPPAAAHILGRLLSGQESGPAQVLQKTLENSRAQDRLLER